jgi:hypothetical protein
MISLQRAAPAFPYALDLSPVRVEAAQAGVSTLGLAFGSEAQPEGIKRPAWPRWRWRTFR